MVAELEAKIVQKNRRIKFLEGILKEKVPNFDIINSFQMVKEDMAESEEEELGLRAQLEVANTKIKELEASLKNALEGGGGLSVATTPTRSGSKRAAQEAAKTVLEEMASPIFNEDLSRKMASGEKISDRVKQKLAVCEKISPGLSTDVSSIIERFEVENQALQSKISKMKSKYTTFISEFKKTTVKDLESLENVHKTLINKAVAEERDESNVFNVDLIKILSYLHLDNRKLKMEIKNQKGEFKEKQDEWADQREKLRDKLDAYGDKINRLQKILNKFLSSYSRDSDGIPGSRSTIGGARILDWQVFSESLGTKDEDEDPLESARDPGLEFKFQNIKKTIKGRQKD